MSYPALTSQDGDSAAFTNDASWISSVASTMSSANSTTNDQGDTVETQPQLKPDMEFEHVLLKTSTSSYQKAVLVSVHRLQVSADMLFQSADAILESKELEQVNARLSRMFIRAERESNNRLVRFAERVCTMEHEARKTTKVKARAASVRMAWRLHAHAYRARAEAFERLELQVTAKMYQLRIMGQDQTTIEDAAINGFAQEPLQEKRNHEAQSYPSRLVRQHHRAEHDPFDRAFGRIWLMQWGARRRCKQLLSSLRAGRAMLMNCGKRCDWIANQLLMVESAITRRGVRERLLCAEFIILKSTEMPIEDVVNDRHFRSIARQFDVY
ncbi:hypothetical protein ACHAQH_001889 [Verticillium albo-atrum]